MSGDNWETMKHMTNEGRHMKSTKGKGMLSTMPTQKYRPALIRVSNAAPNKGIPGPTRPKMPK